MTDKPPMSTPYRILCVDDEVIGTRLREKYCEITATPSFSIIAHSRPYSVTSPSSILPFLTSICQG